MHVSYMIPWVSTHLHASYCTSIAINKFLLHCRRGHRHSRNIRRGEEGSENWWETFVGLRLMVIYRKVVESNGLVWLIRDKETRRLSGFVFKWEKKKREGRSRFGEGSKLMTEGSNGRVSGNDGDWLDKHWGPKVEKRRKNC